MRKTIKSDDIAELRRATDLLLRATKETAKATGRYQSYGSPGGHGKTFVVKPFLNICGKA